MTSRRQTGARGYIGNGAGPRRLAREGNALRACFPLVEY